MRRWALAAILALAALLRLPSLTTTPPGPAPDEASNSVDARCLWLAGCDRYGKPWPLYLRGVDDYRDAAFTVMAAPLVGLSGDSLLGLRGLAAAIGLGTVALTYLAGKRFFGEREGLWAALFLAVNPQHVLWSRLGMEAILVPFAGMLALLAYESCERRPRLGPILLALSLVLVIYSGPMGKALAVVLAILIAARPPSLAGGRGVRVATISLSLAILAIGSVPAWRAILEGTAGIRRYQKIGVQGATPEAWLAEVGRNYFAYWSPRYLLLPKGGGAPDLPTAGKLGYAEFACLVAGAAFLLRDRPKHSRLLLLFLLLYAIPASTTERLASSRMLFGLPVLGLIAGYGAGRLSGLSRGPWVARGIALAALGTFGLTLYDLHANAREHLDDFFFGPSRRVVLAALKDLRPGETLLIDPEVPFGNLYYLELAKPPLAELRDLWRRPKGRLFRIGRAIAASPRQALREEPHLRGLVILPTSKAISGARTVYREGKSCVQALRTPPEDASAAPLERRPVLPTISPDPTRESVKQRL